MFINIVNIRLIKLRIILLKRVSLIFKLLDKLEFNV